MVRLQVFEVIQVCRRRSSALNVAVVFGIVIRSCESESDYQIIFILSGIAQQERIRMGD